jgi:hypothetical protein
MRRTAQEIVKGSAEAVEHHWALARESNRVYDTGCLSRHATDSPWAQDHEQCAVRTRDSHD